MPTRRNGLRVTLTDVDRGWQQIRRELKKLNINVDAGFFPNQKRRTENGEQFVAHIAAILEYGSPAKNIPPRPFMRQSVQSNSTKWFRRAQHLLGLALDQRIRARAVGTSLGETMVSDIKLTITEGNFAPLSPRTIDARKRRRIGGTYSTKPLIDTGRMRQSVTFRIRKGRAVV